MNLTRSQVIIIGIVVLLILGIIAIFVFFVKPVPKPPEVELNVWGIDAKKVLEANFTSYNELRPNVKINYTQIDEEHYEEDVINALAAGKGPDVFMFRNNWLPKHYDKIVPTNDTQLTLDQFRNYFGAQGIVEQDFAPDKLIYALPLYIDTLARYYNVDIFNSSGIVLALSTWQDFQDSIPKLRQVNKETGEITRAAAAMGGSLKSMANSVDLLTLLMLQRGTQMVDNEYTSATFARGINDSAGTKALEFYTSFANPQNTNYTWDNKQNDVDSFTQGKTAMIFNYYSKKKDIESKNPYLKFQIAPMPQISKEGTQVNYANYWGLAVANTSKSPGWAWDLILYMTTWDKSAQAYLDNTGLPPALRTLTNKYFNDPELGIFAKQSLSARSWPQADNQVINNIFSQMIEAVISGQLDANTAIQQAELQVNELMSRKK